MILVTAMLTAKEGKEGELERVMQALAEKVRAEEPDCHMYQLARAQSDPRSFVVVERYSDQAALDRHANSAHFKTALPELMGCLDGRPDIIVHDEIG